MKKILTLFAILFLTSVLFAACGGSDTPADTTQTGAEQQGESGKDETKAPEGNTANPVPTVDKRTMVYDYMVSMSEVVWTPTGNIDTTDIAKTLYYNKGKEYHGLPYINLDVDTDLEEFMEVLRYDEATKKYYYDETERSKILGNDCSSAILLSWKLLDGNIKATNTNDMFPLGAKTGVYILGNLKADDFKTTAEIIKANSSDDYFAALTTLKKGDAILTRWTTENGGHAGHIRMLVGEPTVTKKGNGEINPGRSYVTTIEQTNSMDKERKDGVNTCWYVNHTYTFQKLYESGYVPVSCDALISDKFEPYQELKIKASGINSKKTLANTKSLMGEVTANYAIQKAEVKLERDDGTVIFDSVSKPRSYVFKLTGVKYTANNEPLPAGNYVFTVSITTACGETEAYRAEYTK